MQHADLYVTAGDYAAGVLESWPPETLVHCGAVNSKEAAAAVSP